MARGAGFKSKEVGMNRIKQAGLTAVLLAIGGLLRAQESVPYDAAPDEPKSIATGIFHVPQRLSAAGLVIDSGAAWGHSGPWVEDVDGDGRRDLVVGDFSGLFRFYRNEGTNPKPSYAAPVNLQAGGTDAKVPIY
jgi:hypothetical protein